MADDYQKEYILEEFKASRERISKEIDIINTIEASFLIAAGAIFAFVFAKDTTIFFVRFGMVFVIILGLYGLWRYNTHRKIIRIHEAYISEEIEGFFMRGRQVAQMTGMMTHYEQNKQKNIRDIFTGRHSGNLKRARFIFWGAMIVVPFFILMFSFCDKTLAGLIKAGS